MSSNKIVMGGPTATEKEGEAAESITPGHLVEYVSGNLEQFQKHSTAGGVAEPLVATKAPYSGDPTTDIESVEDAYAGGDYVFVAGLKRFIRVLGLLFGGSNAAGAAPDVAANADITAGDFLVSYGNGAVRKYDSSNDSPGAVIGVAREDVDNSGSASQARLVYEVL
ncbi:hypothetical protein J2752_000447 [Halarchaeum rubridurum]|uniref:Uncharacterized protein n=1 Tax=Halarchaeum rubridurum TaxID=489911 RepID=A0A830FUZ3_9EURY|nr:hypothetical protein [Halarchaeum rubridurum]MBP1953566.1 hypothetical protein [Halarchaeum rubridurum]GGM64345.1 hypothetical protein GCM10009017_12950 [Halarchaeum rubridurum]